MKNSLLLPVILTISFHVNAQGVFSNKINTALEKVIQDYPNQFSNIKGTPVSSSKQAVIYQSTVSIPGAVSTSLTTYSSNHEKDSYCWQANVFESHEFAKAKIKFKELYDQIRNTIVKVDGEKPVILNGQYEHPDVSQKLTTVHFDLLPASGEMKKLRVDISMKYIFEQWKILVRVYDVQQPDDLTAATAN